MTTDCEGLRLYTKIRACTQLQPCLSPVPCAESMPPRALMCGQLGRRPPPCTHRRTFSASFSATRGTCNCLRRLGAAAPARKRASGQHQLPRCAAPSTDTRQRVRAASEQCRPVARTGIPATHIAQRTSAGAGAWPCNEAAACKLAAARGQLHFCRWVQERGWRGLSAKCVCVQDCVHGVAASSRFLSWGPSITGMQYGMHC